MNRRTLIIIASAIVILGILVGVYFLFFAKGATLSVDTGGVFGPSTDKPATNTDNGPIQGAGTVIAPRLMKITDGPVAKGVVALYIPETIVSASSTSAASSTRETIPSDVEVRYIERQSGNVYAFRVHDRVLARTSNRTLPGIQEAVWTSDGQRAFSQYLTKGADGAEHVDTYALRNDGGEGFVLEEDLGSIAVQGTSTLFTLLPTSSGSIGSLASPDGTSARTLFSSPLSSLTVAFAGNDLIATTKGSYSADGYAFLVSRAAGTFTRLLGPFRGLATLPDPQGRALLFSYVDKGKLYTQVLDISAGTVTSLPLATLSEKCTWEPGGRALYCAVPTTLGKNLPDEWYQGGTQFTDRIWRIDLDTRLATLIVDPSQVGKVDIDAVSLTLDPSADVLVFINRRDGSLWSYDLQ